MPLSQPTDTVGATAPNADVVLVPELAKPSIFVAAGLTIPLRPLPIKHARIINAMIKPLEKLGQAGDDTDTMSQVDLVGDIYVSVTTHLLSFYGQEGKNKEWVEENLGFTDVQRLVDQQLEVQDSHDFLLAVFRRSFGLVKEMTETIVKTKPEPNPPQTS